MTVEIAPWALAGVAIVCLMAGFAHGALGFGFPLVATPLVALMIDIRLALGLLGPATLAMVVISALRGGGFLKLMREYWFLPPAMAIGAAAGTKLLLVTPPEPFLLVLAAVILVYLNLDRLGRGRSRAVERWRAPVGFVVGLVAGALEALVSVAMPPLLIYFLLIGVAPLQVVQAVNFSFVFSNGARVATWAASGALSPGLWAFAAALIVPAVATLFLGMRVRERIDAATYRRWLRGALWVMAAVLVFQYFR
jgi:uncharacterized membrane protein YfcA